ncbi:IS5 family transposase [Massilia pseudoviolaceinigra]|uniref:IS5 family transposase n=1 Tax=Massilia pseudoviolaceinigra TaxID=3057165 RepID=UPI002796B82F|nr:IS5 family transposase [Massilia sp. CCM 9206]MDQ1924839.1 IS5 family transposase [Massilia sp. CCM 9206]
MDMTRQFSTPVSTHEPETIDGRDAPSPVRCRGSTDGIAPLPDGSVRQKAADADTAFQLLDRLSFQRFVGLRASSQIPERTTIWTFKEPLIQANASESIFEAADKQLSKHGYIARGGQMIDASIVQAPKQSFSKEEKALVAEGAMPITWGPAKRRQKDTDARWTKKHGKSFYGYKVSANADKRYKLVRKIKVSTASEHDTRYFEDVLDPNNTSRDILADKGYVDGEREERLTKQGWRMHFQRKGTKDNPISEAQERRNRRIAKTRARVEHVFAGLAQLGGKVVRSIGLPRATLQLNWKVAAYNLQRLIYLKEAGVEAF